MTKRCKSAGSRVFTLRKVLLLLTGVHFVILGGMTLVELRADQTTPAGGDFLNLWTTAQLISGGRTADIYDPSKFMAFQWDEAGGYTGFRVWAYPPHSLPVAWIFGLPSYHMAWLFWSLVGIGALWWGARRMGLGRTEALYLVLSPAALLCVFLGQSGNLMVGLLMAALATRGRVDLPSVLATVTLSLKPQLGLLIPVLWGAHRRWMQICLTASGILIFIGLSVLATGAGVWQDYVGLTLPALASFEREGTGPFMYMIPSVFMAARILLDDVDLAVIAHLLIAIPTLVYVVIRIAQNHGRIHQQALVLLGTGVLLPYIHFYDLAIVLAGALLVLPGKGGKDIPSEKASGFAMFKPAIVFAWGLPYLTLLGNLSGFPVAPLVLIAVLLITDRNLAGRAT